MNNIDEFNIVVGEVFGKCYLSFPCPIDIRTTELGDTLKKAKGQFESGTLNLGDPEYATARDSVQWLIDSGYLWCKTPRADVYMKTTLAPKGLEVLNGIPDGLEIQRSLGEQLSQGVVELGKEATKKIVLSALAAGSKMVVGI